MGLGHTARAMLLGSAALALTAAGQGGALAQQARENTQAEPAQNDTQPKAETSKTTRLDRITVVSRTGESAMETMASVSHVDQEAIERRMASTPTDIFFGVPGVTGQADARRVDSSINIRGLQDFGRVAVIIDGARQDFQRSDHGTQSTFWIDPELIQSVDVIRGPVANAYGSGAIGGVVFFETKDAEDFLHSDETWATSLTERYETNGHGWTTSATGAYRFNDNFSVLGNLVYRDYGNYKDGDGNTVNGTAFDVLSGMLKTTIRPTDNSKLQLGWVGASDNWTELSTSTGNPTHDVDLKQNTFTARYNLTDDERKWLDLHVNLSYGKTDLTRTYLQDTTEFDPDGQPTVNIPAGAQSTYDLDNWGIDIWNTSRFETGALGHELTYGGDWVSDDVVTGRAGGGMDVYTPSGTRTVGGLYLQDKLTWEWLEIVGGLRYDTYRLDSDIGKVTGERLSPRVTVGVSPFQNLDGALQGLQFYGTYAEGYRSPSITETLMSGMHPSGVTFPFLPNPNLKPETAKTWEFGVNYHADGILQATDALRLKAAYFHNDINDYIKGNDEIPPGSIPGCVDLGLPFPYIPTCFQYQNYANAKIEGVELESMYDADWGYVGLSASFINGHTVSYEGVRDDLDTVPSSQVTGQLGLRFLQDKLLVGGEVQFNGKPKGNDLARDYTLVNAFARYNVNDNFKLDFRVDNIFDVAYINALNAVETSLYEPGVTFKLAATMRWGG
jgi:hemoglobin/transferrin/lactoferrin receptor protein